MLSNKISAVRFGGAGVVSVATLVLLAATSSHAAPGDTLRINSGGPAYTDSKGQVWAADSGFTAGSTYEDFNATISGTADPALHQDERYGDGEDFSYNFNMNPGTYTVKLYNATLWDGGCGVGTRVFDVTINGKKVLTDYDMNTKVDCLTETIESIPLISTNDGKINITFNVGAMQNPKINAIEIVRTGEPMSLQGSKAALNHFAVSASTGGLLVTSRVEGAYSVSLMDVQGRLIEQKSGLGTGAQSFTNLRPGLYFLTFVSGTESVTRKVQVVR